MKFAKFISANSWYSCFSFFTTILEKNNNSFIHRFSHYFPSFLRFDIQLLHLLRYEYSVCYLLVLPSPFHPPFHPSPKKKQQSMSFPNLPRLLASLVPAVPHSQVTIPSHPAQTPRRREGSSVSGFQYRYRNIGGCQIHIEHCYEEISRPTSRTHRQYSFPNECNMNRQICLFFFFHIFFFINNGATLPLRSQPWRRVTDFSDLFNFLSLLLSFLCFWLFHFPFFTISSVFFCVLFLINIFPFELLYK